MNWAPDFEDLGEQKPIRKLKYSQLTEEHDRLHAESYQSANFHMKRWFSYAMNGAYFIGVTQAHLESPYQECFLNFYLGKPMRSNFLAASPMHLNPAHALTDPTNGNLIEVIDPSEIPQMSTQYTDSVWACIQPFVDRVIDEATSSTPDDTSVEYHPERKAAVLEKIAEAERFIVSSMDELTTAARELSKLSDLFVPDLTPEPVDQADIKTKDIGRNELQELESGEHMSTLARSYRGNFFWQSTHIETDLPKQDVEEVLARRLRGDEPWMPPQAHPHFSGKPNPDFSQWLNNRVEGSLLGPSDDIIVNCWEVALIIGIIAGVLNPEEIKRDSEVGDPLYVMKYFMHGHAHQDLRVLRNDINRGDFIGVVNNDLLEHVGIVVEENKEDYREIVTMSHGMEDYRRYTKIKWGKIAQGHLVRMNALGNGEDVEKVTGASGLYFLYGPFATS